MREVESGMSFKDVLLLLTGDDGDRQTIESARALGVFGAAHVAAALLAPIPDPVFVGDLSGGALMLGEFIVGARVDALAAQGRARSWLEHADLAYEERLVLAHTLQICDMATVQARHVDLSVMARPQRIADWRYEVMEAVLMESGRPLLLLPPEAPVTGPADTVLVAWNAGREAARVLGDASPWLSGAKQVVVTTVDARPAPRGHGEAPGVDIATHLARHGHAVTLQNIDGGAGDVGQALLHMASDIGADLIVSGGFGHARVQQALFGGVTRTLIESSRVPLLMSH